MPKNRFISYIISIFEPPKNIGKISSIVLKIKHDNTTLKKVKITVKINRKTKLWQTEKKLFKSTLKKK